MIVCVHQGGTSTIYLHLQGRALRSAWLKFFRIYIGLRRIRSLLPPDVTRSPIGCGIPDAPCAAPPKATMSLRRPQARGSLLFDFPKNLQEIAMSALWGLAMTFIIVGHAVPSVPSENSGSMHEFSAGYAASRTDR